MVKEGEGETKEMREVGDEILKSFFFFLGFGHVDGVATPSICHRDFEKSLLQIDGVRIDT